MDKQFDELSKSLAEGVSRREALKKFGIGLAGVVLAAMGLRSRAWAGGGSCTTNADCNKGKLCCGGECLNAFGPKGAPIGCSCTTPCPPGTSCTRTYGYAGYNYFC